MFKFKVPSRILICGSSGSGKSQLCAHWINNQAQFFELEFDKIFYCAKYETSLPHSLRNNKLVSFHENLPTEDLIRNDASKNICFVLDDLMESAFNSDTVSEMFTQGRNRKVSTILLTQNLFPRVAKARNISLNANYVVIFRNIRDASSVNNLARQVCPTSSRAFSDIIINNLTRPYSNLLLDFTPTIPDLFRYRGDILSEHPTVYINEGELQKVGTKFGSFEEVQGYCVEIPEV